MFANGIAGCEHHFPQALDGVKLFIVKLPDAFQERIDFNAGHRDVDLG